MIPAVLLLALGLIVAAVLALADDRPPADPDEFTDIRALQRSIDQRAAMRRVTKGPR